jgi:hypothetical protein
MSSGYCPHNLPPQNCAQCNDPARFRQMGAQSVQRSALLIEDRLEELKRSNAEILRKLKTLESQMARVFERLDGMRKKGYW